MGVGRYWGGSVNWSNNSNINKSPRAAAAITGTIGTAAHMSSTGAAEAIAAGDAKG